MNAQQRHAAQVGNTVSTTVSILMKHGFIGDEFELERGTLRFRDADGNNFAHPLTIEGANCMHDCVDANCRDEGRAADPRIFYKFLPALVMELVIQLVQVAIKRPDLTVSFRYSGWMQGDHSGLTLQFDTHRRGDFYLQETWTLSHECNRTNSTRGVWVYRWLKEQITPEKVALAQALELIKPLDDIDAHLLAQDIDKLLEPRP